MNIYNLVVTGQYSKNDWNGNKYHEIKSLHCFVRCLYWLGYLQISHGSCFLSAFRHPY